MSGSVLQLGPPTPYDPYAWQQKKAEAEGAQATTVGKQIQNELANLGLQYKAAFQSKLMPALGGKAPQIGNPIANQGSGIIDAIAQAVRPSDNALAPYGAAPAGGNALAPRGDPAQATGPQGIVLPGSGIAMPLAVAQSYGADPEKGMQVLKEYQTYQREQVKQAINSATDSKSWDANIDNLWNSGVITTKVAEDFKGKFSPAYQRHLSNSLASPESQQSTALSAISSGLDQTPTGDRPYRAQPRGGPGEVATQNISRGGGAGGAETRVDTIMVPKGDGTYEERKVPQSQILQQGEANPIGGRPDPNLPRGIRNNNPLNLEFVPGQGAGKSDGRFGVYPTMEDGIAANVRQIASYGADRGLTTVNGIINRWAPPGENDTASYVSQVSKALGVKPDAQLDLTNPQTMSRLVMAMGQVENKGHLLDPAAVQQGVRIGLAGKGAPAGAPVATPTSVAVPTTSLPGVASSAPTGAIANVEQNQNAYRAEQSAVAKLPLQNTQLTEASDAIRRLAESNLTTGPGQAALQTVRKFISGFGGTPEMERNAVDAVMAEKLLAKAIADQMPASDSRQALLEKANPGLQMPPGASLPIIAQIVASNRAREAVVKSADPKGNGFLTHQTDQSALLNSREGLAALSYDLMDAKARDALKADLKAGKLDAEKFYEAFRLGHSTKVLK